MLHVRDASPMQTTIQGFHQDELGDWVAELRCGHTQHMRHRPPWQNRSWVAQEAERAQRIGAVIDCSLCDRDSEPLK
jgi:hypothetical protein